MAPPRISTTDDPPTSARRANDHLPLLALATPALEQGEEYFSGQHGKELEIRDVYNAKASLLVKDGQRLENLAWRNWSQQRQHAANSTLRCDTATHRRSSFGSVTTASTASLYTPGVEAPPSPTTSTGSRSDRVTFNDALRKVMHADSFTDWVGEAQLEQAHKSASSPPVLSVPDTPIANLEIRLVEPTPVPSRVGSLGGSINASGLLNVAARPPRLTEEPEAEEVVDDDEEDEGPKRAVEPVEEEDDEIDALKIKSKSKSGPRTSPKKRGKFFVHSSPSKGSGSDSATSPSTLKSPIIAPAAPAEQPPSPSMSNGSRISAPPNRHPRRHSSLSSAGGPSIILAARKKSPRSPEKKRNVSLSSMRGRFTAEKRRAAEVIERKAAEAQQAEAEAAAAAAEAEASADAEGSGWEDEVEGGEGGDEEDEDDEGWSDDDTDTKDRESVVDTESDAGQETGSETAYGRRRSRSQWTEPRDPPPPPAPTPLKSMSMHQRQAAKAERQRIEAELEAQQKREMFAKQQIFGSHKPSNAEGLLSGIFKRGGSMVNLNEQNTPASPPLKPSPTHGHLPSLARSPLVAGPSLLRSKSAVAMPVQTGVSVTRISPKRSRLSEEIGSGASDQTEATSVNTAESPDVAVRPARPARPHRSSDQSLKSVKSVRGSSKERNIPEDVELESDSSDEEEDQYLATSSTRQKLEQLAQKAATKGKGKVRIQDEPSEIGGSSTAMVQSDSGSSTAPQPLLSAALNGLVLDDRGVVMPMSPGTRRREIIKREMSVSLRQKRAKSSGGQKRHASFGPVQHSRPPPSTHTSLLPARHSSAQLANHPILTRHRSDVDVAAQRSGDVTPTGLAPTHSALRQSPSPTHGQDGSNAHNGDQQRTVTFHNPPEPVRRRTQPNVLGGYLRPLTRVGGLIDATGNRSDGAIISRTQSSANLTTAPSEVTRSLSPGDGDATSPHGHHYTSTNQLGSSAVGLEQGYEAPAMVRRSTEGSPHAHWKDDIERRRELVRRSVAQDQGYRTHGW